MTTISEHWFCFVCGTKVERTECQCPECGQDKFTNSKDRGN